MPESFPLPYSNFGPPPPLRGDFKDPKGLYDHFLKLHEAVEDLRGNFTAIQQAFPLNAPKLLQNVHMSDTAESTLTLTTSYQDIPGISITLPLAASNYLLLYVFDFAVSPAGVGQCLGVAKVGSTVLGNAATFQLGASGDAGVATIGNFHVASGARGDEVVLQARKTIAAGTAQVSNVNTRLSVFGPL